MIKENRLDNPSREIEQIEYVKYLRILASFMVVVIHVSMQITSFDFYTTRWAFGTFFNCLSRTAVPIFFFITGALLGDERKNYTGKETLKKCLRFVVIAFIWFWIYALSDYCIFNVVEIQRKYHLWFIFTYIGLILVTPVIKLLCKKENEKLIRYLIIVFVIGNLLVSVFARSKTTLLNLISLYDIVLLESPVFLFITGWYLNNFDVSKFKKLSYFVLFCNFLASIFVTLYCCVYQKSMAFDDFIQYYNIFIYSTTVSIFIIFKYSKFTKKTNKVVESISKRTFLIYLLHILVIDILFQFIRQPIFELCKTWWALLIIPGVSAIIYLISIALAYLIWLIPKRVRKYIC